jgi:mannose/cellobiose epimerase-like protein (N-acyl-D-glucosamine 2-epimerase family)
MSGGASLLSQWLFDKTLPYWRTHAIDHELGGFHEMLDSTLLPASESGKRIMVQGRLIFVFSQAYLQNHHPADLNAAKAGFEFLKSYGLHSDGGWRHKVGRTGAPLDDNRDLYDQAFVLFAMAWYGRASGSAAALDFADFTIDFLDTRMAHPKGGYVNALPDGAAPHQAPESRGVSRLQNPHMHLLEAFLALYETTNDDRWLEHAKRVIALFKGRFIVDGTLREYFSDAWMPQTGDVGQITEPGHHFEWVWLLHKFARLANDPSVVQDADSLYHFANNHGVDEKSGGVLDEVSAIGSVLRKSRRLWPQTEVLKAHAALLKAGDDAAAVRLEAALQALWLNHLDGVPAGGWREHLDENDSPLRTDMPASSLYHLSMAVAELNTLAN